MSTFFKNKINIFLEKGQEMEQKKVELHTPSQVL
jgi:hypothetical protein